MIFSGNSDTFTGDSDTFTGVSDAFKDILPLSVPQPLLPHLPQPP